MPSITVSTEIDATVDHVWNIVEPIETHVQWMHDAQAIRFTGEQQRGVGTKFVCDTKVGPFRLQDKMDITEWSPPHVMGVRHEGLVTGNGRFELTAIDHDRRTRFTWSETLRFPWWMGGPVGAAVGAKLLAAIWRRNLRLLRDLCEGREA
jgi:carbon monoxide dehydrogenase subunit G